MTSSCNSTITQRFPPEIPSYVAIFSQLCTPSTILQEALSFYNLEIIIDSSDLITTNIISPFGNISVVYATVIYNKSNGDFIVVENPTRAKITQRGSTFVLQPRYVTGELFLITYNFTYLEDILQTIVVNIPSGGNLSVLQNDNTSDGPGYNPDQLQNVLSNNSRSSLLESNLDFATNLQLLENFCNTQNLPQIFINGLSTSGNNLGILSYSIYDTVSYTCDPNLPKHTKNLSQRNGHLIYKSNFTQSFPIQTVLKGPGINVREKINSIIQKFGIRYSFTEFLLLISFYAAIRFILSFVLTSKFKINFLLEKNYKKFLMCLKNSRFRQFINLFGTVMVNLYEVPTLVDFSVFYKYFYYDKRCMCNNFDAIEVQCSIAHIYCNKCQNKCQNKCPVHKYRFGMWSQLR